MFARVSPAQKNRIILALKHRSHVVGFLGDGINDAPSLHTADVGISVAGAVDVAKDAADIILLERGLDVLHAGIIEGRKAFANVLKYLLMGTSSNFGNMFSMAGASLFLPFLPMLPTQILLNNFLYDLAQVTIPTDNVDPAYTRRPQRWDISIIRNFMLLIGPISSIYDFLTFFVLLQGLPRQRSAISYRLVRGVAGDANPGVVRDSHRRTPMEGSAEPAVGFDHCADCPGRRHSAVFSACPGPRLRCAAARIFCVSGCRHRHLPGTGRNS